MPPFRVRFLPVAVAVMFALSIGVAAAEQRSVRFAGMSQLPPFASEVKCAVAKVEFSDEGLSIAMDHEGEGDASGGILIKTPLAGDFQFTLDYSLGDVTPPKNGIGSGVKIYAKTIGPKNMALTFAHLIAPDKKPFYLVMLRPGDNVNNRFQKFEASDGKSGSLRISRVKNDLVYSVSSGDGGEFKELFKTFVEPQALTGIRLVNSVSGASKSEVVLRNAELVADRFDRQYVRRSGDGSAIMAMLLFFAVGIGGAAAVWFFVGRKKGKAVESDEETP